MPLDQQKNCLKPFFFHVFYEKIFGGLNFTKQAAFIENKLTAHDV